jgi:hypothetical protein
MIGGYACDPRDGQFHRVSCCPSRGVLGVKGKPWDRPTRTYFECLAEQLIVVVDTRCADQSVFSAFRTRKTGRPQC